MSRVMSVAGDDMVYPFASVTLIGPGQYKITVVSRPNGSRHEQSLLVNAAEYHVLVEAAIKALVIPLN